MDPIPTPIPPPPIASPAIPQPPAVQSPQVKPVKKFHMPKWLPIVIILILVILVGIGVLTRISGPSPQQTTDVPTPTPALQFTPQPSRSLSGIGTQPEFQDFQAAVATLSAAIAEYTVNDPTLTPPQLVLPLGFNR